MNFFVNGSIVESLYSSPLVIPFCLIICPSFEQLQLVTCCARSFSSLGLESQGWKIALDVSFNVNYGLNYNLTRQEVLNI